MGLSGVSALEVQPFGGQAKFAFDPDLVTFTEGMAKRPGTVFAGAPICQGKWDGSGTPDVLSFARGAQVASNFYAQFDPYQGGGFLIWTPEQSSGDRTGSAYLWREGNGSSYLRYDYDNGRYHLRIGGQSNYTTVAVTAGTPEYLAWGFDTNQTLDGTNYSYLSRNDVQDYGIGTQPLNTAPAATFSAGCRGENDPANGIIEGLTFVREVPWTGAYGSNLHFGQDIVALHAAGNDVCKYIQSWGVTFCLPTNATTGRLSTGEGEAWTHPHASNLLGVGGLMLDGTYTNDGWADEGTPTAVAALAAAERILPGGYKVTSDAANEGIYQDITVSAGDDVVIRAIGHSDGTSVPKVILYDQDNGAEIGSITGSNASTRAAPDVFLFTGEAPAGCTTIRAKLINTDATAADITYWHQVEVLANLLTNPSMETFDGATPPVPVGWTNSGLDAGDCQASSTGGAVIHSGADCIQFSVGAASEQIIQTDLLTTLGGFYVLGAWAYTDGGILKIGLLNDADGDRQDGSDIHLNQAWTITSGAAWNHGGLVIRTTTATGDPHIRAQSGATGNRYADDAYAFLLNPVSLTATAASKANSAETSGLRVDGDDACYQTITGIKATKGRITWDWTPRHDAADLSKFGEVTTPMIADFYYNASNYIRLRASAANTIQLRCNIQGAGQLTDTWDCTGAIVAGTTYAMEIRYTSTKIDLLVDAVVKATITTTVGFGATIPTLAFWGGRYTTPTNANEQSDGTFAAP